MVDPRLVLQARDAGWATHLTRIGNTWFTERRWEATSHSVPLEPTPMAHFNEQVWTVAAHLEEEASPPPA